MKGGERVIVIELETLDKARVEHGGGRGTGRATSPADERSTACVVQRGHTLDALARDGKLSADQGATDTIEHQVLGVLPDRDRYVAQGGCGKPGCQPTRGSLGVGRRTAYPADHRRINVGVPLGLGGLRLARTSTRRGGLTE